MCGDAQSERVYHKKMLTGREKELQYLQKLYKKDGSQIVVLYGRKGVGKTRLVREFTENIPCFYYACRDASEREQRVQWGRELSEAGIAAGEFPAWPDLFAGSLKSASVKQVFVLDEFQYLIKGGSNFMDELTAFVEETGRSRELLVILISSSLVFVEKDMVKKMGRAAHKLSGLLKIRSLGFYQMRDAFPEYSSDQAFGLYAVLGGNPGLWQCMSPAKSLKDNICETILSPTGVLSGECRRILSEELRELSVYQTILSALADGHHKLNNIYEYTEFSRAKISVYLKNLMELELIEKVFSYDTAGREHVQKGVYRICDHFLHFWFTYLYPHASRLEQTAPQTFYDRDIFPGFRRYMSQTFREICREYVQREAATGRFPFVISSMGEWAGKAGDIDFIAQSSEGETLLALGQCEREKFPYEDYEWLLFLARQAKLRTDHIWLFADRGFDERLTAEAKEKKNLSLILL